MKQNSGWWKWPETGTNSKELEESIKNIESPFSQVPPPFCYPGTTLDKSLIPYVSKFLEKQISCIGTHTHGKRENSFEKVQEMEREFIWMVASVVGGTPNTTDGYCCSGGSEANYHGIWMGREWLKKNIQTPAPNKQGVVLISTALRHHSVDKGFRMMLSDNTENEMSLVGINSFGEMDVKNLGELLWKKISMGYRRFLVAATVGTSLTGSIDPIKEISDLLSDFNSKRDIHVGCYLHVDASFAGFTVPFVNPDLSIGFQNSAVMSMTLDANKMGRLPYPAGIFLCRKNLQELTSEANYAGGNRRDDTIPGSRGELTPVLGWYWYKIIGLEGQREYVRICLQARNQLAYLLNITFQPPNSPIEIMPYSQWVNFLPIVINIKDGRIPNALLSGNGILAPYQLRAGVFPETVDENSRIRIVYKLCIMPHTIPYLDRFVDDLKRALKQCSK